MRGRTVTTGEYDDSLEVVRIVRARPRWIPSRAWLRLLSWISRPGYGDRY